MLWFKIFFGLKFFKPVWFLFSFVSDYDNQYKTMKTKNQTGLKNFKPKKNLNHNISRIRILTQSLSDFFVQFAPSNSVNKR